MGSMPDSDSFDLHRFIQAQAPVYAQVCAELTHGSKRTHWMWFIFPQLKSLGRSAVAQHYGIAGLDEARAYLGHPVLAPRLTHCCELLLDLPATRAARDIFGTVDELKLRSCVTLFAAAAPGVGIFAAVLDRFFDGEPDRFTLDALRCLPRP